MLVFHHRGKEKRFVLSYSGGFRLTLGCLHYFEPVMRLIIAGVQVGQMKTGQGSGISLEGTPPVT